MERELLDKYFETQDVMQVQAKTMSVLKMHSSNKEEANVRPYESFRGAELQWLYN
jgi:hypothetical protein